MDLPKIGELYNSFDDGKIKETRRMSVKITDIIPFDEASEVILTMWKEEVENCYWLYNEQTDYFIVADLYVSDDIIYNIIYVRTKQNKWFSLGDWGGKLNCDGSLTEYVNSLN